MQGWNRALAAHSCYQIDCAIHVSTSPASRNRSRGRQMARLRRNSRESHPMASFDTPRQSRRLQAPSARTAALIQPRSSPSIARMRRTSNRSRAAPRSNSAPNLPGHDLVEIENENAPRPNAAEDTRLQAGRAEQRLARHVVQAEFRRRVATECGRVALEPLAYCVPGRPAADTVTVRGEQAIDRGIDLRTFALHRRQIQRADVVQVDIHRESVEIEVEDIECRSALQRETLRKHRVLRDLVQQLHSRSRSTFSSVSSRYPISVASRCSVWTVGGAIQSPSKPRSATSTGTMTFQPLAVLADPGFAPSA